MPVTSSNSGPGPDTWQAVDDYLAALLLPDDPTLEAALEAASDAGLPSIQVFPMQGRMLELLAASIAARRVLEVGTLGGYSTLWLARGVGRDGRVVTLELDEHHAATARESLARADRSEQVEVIVGPAVDSMQRLVQERRAGAEPFDLVFIDADKASMPAYVSLSLQLVRPGALIVADNVVRGGRLIDEAAQDDDVRGVRQMLQLLRDVPGVRATALQTVGSKSYDGFALVLVDDPDAAAAAAAGSSAAGSPASG